MDKVSVVTVTFNCKKDVEKTILSVVNQTFENIEYIIIDGASKDGTLDVISKYEDKIAYFISEPDKGIYDAMNKAIAVATGEWIIFMNAGDTFFSTSTLVEIFKNNKPAKVGVIYGDVNFVYEHCGNIIRSLSGCGEDNAYAEVCHQGTLTRLSVMRKYSFDTQYRICADRDSFSRMHNDGVIFYYVPVCIANYIASVGFSATNLRQSKYELKSIVGQHYSLLQKLGFHVKLFVRCAVFKCMPERVYERMMYNYAKTVKYE